MSTGKYNLDPDARDPDALEAKLDKTINEVLSKDDAAPPCAGKTVKIPVRYNGDDLIRVAELNGLTVRQVVELHAAGEYTVAMIGFMPHFPYLIGLHARLATPRLDSPRTRVPAGSVAIGGAQTGIYPLESPERWNLIGSCNPRPLTDLLPGDGSPILS